jgi:hypothetical protein
MGVEILPAALLVWVAFYARSKGMQETDPWGLALPCHLRVRKWCPRPGRLPDSPHPGFRAVPVVSTYGIGQDSVMERPLTTREIQVLTLLAQGLYNKEIADRLTISIKTVEKHRQKLKAKLGRRETAGLTRCAVGMGLVPAA